MMKKNILKIQLLILFVATVFSFITFYYGTLLPDNVFTITSENSLGFISYYLFSLITYISYFTGPWIVIPFFIFSLCFTFIYDKRDYFVDVIGIIPLAFFVSSLTFFFYPGSLGEGLSFTYKTYFDTMWLVIYCCSSLIIFLVVTFRSSFKDYVLAMGSALASLPGKLKKSHSKISNALTFKKDTVATQDVRSRVANMLKADEQRLSEEGASKKSLRDSLSKMDLFKKKDVEPEAEEITEEENHDIAAQFVNEPVANTGPFVENESKRDPVRKEVSSRRALARVADTKNDSKYFNIVETIADVKTNKVSNEPDTEYFEQIINLLESKLHEFKIEGSIVNVLKGPVVDTFEFKPGAGIKVSKIANLSEDLSLALYGVPIRVVPSMMGRDTIGVEVPRSPREFIYLDEVLSSKEYIESKYALPVAMGKNAFGESFVVDLSACPHMLVAGATGAGKSVFINALLVSLLVKKSPKKMKLILIDPKQLELALYAKLPHLIMPVVTDAKTASIALLWAVEEMDRRYTVLKTLGVRNIAGFNEKLKTASPAKLAEIHEYYESSGAEDYELPYIVIIVDEFADLILTKAGKEIELNIARIAAKARAAGIHLVLATQRPSVDVITGVIKSNFPTRVSFRVTSQTDSRTILDKMGAERLLGKGDMLYKHGITTQRVHSSFVDENEIEALANKLIDIPQTFCEGAMEFLDSGGEVETDDYSYGSHLPTSNDKSDDEMYSQAIQIVMENRTASASMLQRRLRIGYNRAANLVEEMEKRGIVGPSQGSKPRKVLMSPDGAQL